LISQEEVHELENWVEKENPSLEVLEARAEELRKRKVSELRLFPQVKGLKESLTAFQAELQ
jgi:G3E family GTPase